MMPRSDSPAIDGGTTGAGIPATDKAGADTIGFSGLFETPRTVRLRRRFDLREAGERAALGPDARR